MESVYRDKKTGHEVKVCLGMNSLKNFEPGFQIEIRMPNGGIVTHCSPNIAEAILETIIKADLLKGAHNH